MVLAGVGLDGADPGEGADGGGAVRGGLLHLVVGPGDHHVVVGPLHLVAGAGRTGQRERLA